MNQTGGGMTSPDFWAELNPWSHYINKLNKSRINKVESISDLGLNGLSLKQYEKLFFHTKGLKVIDFRTNVTQKFLGKLSKTVASIPGLKEYFTYNINCILERVA